MSEEEKKPMLIYDICSVPHGFELQKVVHIWKEHNFVMWDSENGGNEPILTEETEGVLIDISNTTPEILNKINKLIEK